MPTVDPSFRYAWLIWASAFLLPWTALFVARPALRRLMLWTSALTAPFGLTELLFVPAYWNPPSLFDLAHRTGLDIESLILCFAIGGLAAAGYRVLAPAPERALAPHARNSHLHRWHLAALASPFFVFGVLLMLPWNPIYPGIAALFVGALASGLCRPDLWRNTLVCGVAFLALYTVFLLGLKLFRIRGWCTIRRNEPDSVPNSQTVTPGEVPCTDMVGTRVGIGCGCLGWC